MNKILTRIATACVGLAMAVGVGVAIGNNSNGYREASAVEVTECYVFTSKSWGANKGSTYASASTAANWTSGQDGGQLTSGQGIQITTGVSGANGSSASYTKVKSVTVRYCTNATKGAGSINVTVGQTSLGDFSVTKPASGGTTLKDTTAFTSQNGVDGSVKITATCSANSVYIYGCSITYDSGQAAPTVSSVEVSKGNLVGTYKGDAYIKCSATVNGDNNPSQDVTWSLSTSSTYASTTSVDGASIDQTGKVSFTKDTTVYAFASSTVPNYTNKRGSIACTASGLLDPVTYVKLDKSGRLSAGLQVIITNSDGTKALSTTQAGNNRPDTGITSTTGTYTTTQIIPTLVQVFTLEAGTVEGSYAFSFQDGNTTKYIFAAGSGNNSYLRTTTSKTDAASFNVTIADSVATIKSCDESKNGYLQHNSGNNLFACYANNGSQDACSIYMLGSELPPEVSLSSISNLSVSNVQIGDTVTLTAKYEPANSTETILVSANVNGKVSFGAVQASNGNVSVSVTGVAAGEVTITLTGKDTQTEDTTKSINMTVTEYSKTHDIVSSNSELFNGKKVIIGGKGVATVNKEEVPYKLASSQHTGGNNNPTVTIPFGSDGLSLSNASGLATEYTIWNLTIKDSEENDVTGWVFYDNGYFLTANESTSSNLLKRTQTLSSLCLFSVTISTSNNETTCDIVAADTHVERNTMRINVSSNGSGIISCYASGQESVQLFSNQSQSDANVATGYERAFLKIGDISTSDKGTGKCKSNGYYEYAKDIYTNVLSNAQKALLSSDALERLSAWADANSETFENGVFSAKQGALVVRTNLDGNSTTTTIVLIAIISTVAVGAFFIIRKKKQQ